MTTPKPIDQLTPEELRVECALSIGWTKHRNNRLKCSPDIPYGDSIFWENDFVPPQFNGNVAHWAPLPRFDSDANAALTLAHALKKFVLSTYHVGNRCIAEFETTAKEPSFMATATGPDAFALALCRAYLAVVRAGKEQIL